MPAPGGWRPGKDLLNVYRDDLRDGLGRSGKTLRAMRRAINEHGAGVINVDDGAVKVWSDLHLGHVNIHGHTHRSLKPAGSPHINVSVEQLGYRPVEMSRLRRLARACADHGPSSDGRHDA